MECLPKDFPQKPLRRLERLCIKLANTKSSIIFNTACKREGLSPNYLTIKFRKNGPREMKDHVKDRVRDALQFEIDAANRKLTNLSASIDADVTHLQRSFQEVSPSCFKQHASHTVEHHFAKKRILIHKKLTALYRRPFALPDGGDKFINLSQYSPTQKEKEYLNLGYVYHIPRQYDPIIKQTELEVLYQQILHQKDIGLIKITPRLHDLLRLEGHTHRQRTPPIPAEIRAAAKSLRQNQDIVLRRADKSATYVILDKTTYYSKIDDILSDASKFRSIRTDPTEAIKREANVLINRMGQPFRQIVGDYHPGYIYGNIKLHKPGHPLRPIISQIPAPVHEAAKTLAKILAPFCPSKYRIKSSTDFLDILRERHPTRSSIASLDVVSLFTNIPVLDTIDIIVTHVYCHPTLAPPPFDVFDLIDLLKLCTCRLPFYHPDGGIFQQIDGVAMGSPLGPLFADFYLGHVEEKVLPSISDRIHTYVRYVDDIFVVFPDESDCILELQQTLQTNSVLKFTSEFPNDTGSLPFLDLLLTTIEGEIHFEPYTKPSDNGDCMRGDGYSSEKLKRAVVVGHLHRAHRRSESAAQFSAQVARIRTLLINNGYTNRLLDHVIKGFSPKPNVKVIPPVEPTPLPQDAEFFYCNQMHDHYLLDERRIRDIVHHNVLPINPALIGIIFHIYYRPSLARSLAMSNSSGKRTTSQRTNVVYQFQCPLTHSQPSLYIGQTRTTLRRRMNYHLQGGSILAHLQSEHHHEPDLQFLLDNTIVLASDIDPNRLRIKEALYISSRRPNINVQRDFINVLSLFQRQREPKTIDRRSSDGALCDTMNRGFCIEKPNSLCAVPHRPSSEGDASTSTSHLALHHNTVLLDPTSQSRSSTLSTSDHVLPSTLSTSDHVLPSTLSTSHPVLANPTSHSISSTPPTSKLVMPSIFPTSHSVSSIPSTPHPISLTPVVSGLVSPSTPSTSHLIASVVSSVSLPPSSKTSMTSHLVTSGPVTTSHSIASVVSSASFPPSSKTSMTSHPVTMLTPSTSHLISSSPSNAFSVSPVSSALVSSLSLTSLLAPISSASQPSPSTSCSTISPTLCEEIHLLIGRWAPTPTLALTTSPPLSTPALISLQLPTYTSMPSIPTSTPTSTEPPSTLMPSLQPLALTSPLQPTIITSTTTPTSSQLQPPAPTPSSHDVLDDTLLSNTSLLPLDRAFVATPVAPTHQLVTDWLGARELEGGPASDELVSHLAARLHPDSAL